MKKNGISLIVLIVTIIVVIILAAVVILTLSKNNPIESAKEARFKEEVRTFQDELALTVSKQYTTAGGHRDTKISTSDFDEIKEYIPSFSEKYRDKFIIQDDELKYTKKLDDNEKEYAQSINVREKNKLLPDEYQQVEYIESTGTQYINTGILAKKNMQVETKIEVTNMQQNITVFGYYSDHTSFHSNGDYFHLTPYKNRWYFGKNGSEGNASIYKNEIGTKYNIIFNDKNESIIINDEVLCTNGIFEAPGDTKITISKRGSKNNSRSGRFKYFYFKIYDKDKNKVIRQLLPCYSTTTVTNADGINVPVNTKGLYDLVEGKFYTNQNTSGNDFTVGPDVD